MDLYKAQTLAYNKNLIMAFIPNAQYLEAIILYAVINIYLSIYFYYLLNMSVFLACIDVHHVYAVPIEAREGYLISRNWSYRLLCLSFNLDPLQEQPRPLTTEPSF